MPRNTPKTRNGGQWTEARFFGFIRSALRRASARWPPACKQVFDEAKRPYKGKNKLQKWEYKCASCGKWKKRRDVQADHIKPCGSLKEFKDLPVFCERLFCEVDGLQVLCKECHKTKTQEERSANSRKRSS